MSTSANVESTEKERVVNGNAEMSVIESEQEPQSHVKENVSSEATKTESLSDWFVMVCVFFTNVLNGINYACYGVLYLPMADMFQASRAAVGWVTSFDFAFGSFLGELETCHGCSIDAVYDVS